MPYLDVCSDGVEGLGPAVGEPAECRFGADAPIPCPAGLWWAFEWVPLINDHLAVAQGHDVGMIWVSRRERRFEVRHPAPCGTNGVLVLSDGRILVSDCAPPIFADGYGWFDYPNAVVVPMQRMIYDPPVHNGVRFIRAYRHYDWEIAQTNLGDFYIAWNYAQPGTIWNVGPSGGSPVQPKIRQMADGSAIAALTAAPTGYFSRSASWTPLGPLPVPIPIPVPVPPPPGPTPIPPPPLPPGGTLVTTPIDHPVWIGIDAARPEDVGNCTWSPADHRPYFEGSDWLPSGADAPRYGPLLGLLFMAKESTAAGTAEFEFTRTVAAAETHGVPVVVVWDARHYGEADAQGRTGWSWSQRVSQAGCAVVHGVRVYPGDVPLDGIHGTERPILLITPVYAPYGEAATEAAQMEADRLLMAWPRRVVGKIAFGQLRQPTLWPTLRAYWQAQRFPARSGPRLDGRGRR